VVIKGVHLQRCQKKSREDMNQAAARIVREATAKD
jgi:hypothetical protein